MICDFILDSNALGERRNLTVLLPPGYGSGTHYPVIFCADGQVLHELDKILTPQISNGHVPPVVLIGVHSNAATRPHDYLFVVNHDRFLAHERFFTGEVFDWAYAEFQLSYDRKRCGVFGVSHGAEFALSLGVRHKAKYGVIIAFSPAGDSESLEGTVQDSYSAPKYYLSVGSREKPLRARTRVLAKHLLRHGVENTIMERHAGHDVSFWSSEFPIAVRWSFPEKAVVNVTMDHNGH